MRIKALTLLSFLFKTTVYSEHSSNELSQLYDNSFSKISKIANGSFVRFGAILFINLGEKL